MTALMSPNPLRSVRLRLRDRLQRRVGGGRGELALELRRLPERFGETALRAIRRVRSELDLPSRDDIAELGERLAAIDRRLAALGDAGLEAPDRRGGAADTPPSAATDPDGSATPIQPEALAPPEGRAEGKASASAKADAGAYPKARGDKEKKDKKKKKKGTRKAAATDKEKKKKKKKKQRERAKFERELG